MAHDLASLMDRVSMSYQGEPPWHALGTPMEGNPDVPAALEAASLNWQVELQDMFLKNGTKVPRKRAVVRDVDQRILATVGSDYVALQNSEAFGVLQPACEQFGCTIESAGALGLGERIWMLAKLPQSTEVVNGDHVDGYFLVTSGHNGKIRYRARPTPVRVVCANTLAMAQSSGKDLINLIHSKNTKDQLSLVEGLVTSMVAALKITGETFSRMAEKKITYNELKFFIADSLGVDEDELDDLEDDNPALFQRYEKMVDLAQNGRGAEFAPRTLWSAFNGITEFVDHVQPGLARSTKSIDAANRSAVFGKNAKLKQRALQLAKRMVA
jgi:phage/plasmid-like protein (TIGR03299 family)